MKFWHKTGVLAIALAAAIAAAAVLVQKPAAPAVTFTSLSGQKIPLESLRGKVVLVNFWATDCPGCIKEMPAIIQTYNKYQGQGLEAIAVAMSYDPPNFVLTYTEKNALPFKVALDVGGEIAHAFGDVRLIPTTFVIDKHGAIVQQTVGESDFAKLQGLIEQKLKEAA